MENTQIVRTFKGFIFALILLFGFQTNAISAQSNAKLPDFLITKYEGVLTGAGSRTRVNTNGTCTIKTKGYRTYAFYFSDDIPPISGIKFIKDDDTYTSTVIYKGKTLAITVDEEGDLSIGATGVGAIAFSGSIEDGRWNDDDASENTTVTTGGSGIHLGTGSTGIHMDGNQTSIGTEDAGIHMNNGNISIGTGDSGIQIENGNITLGTGNSGVSVNSGSSTHSEIFIIEQEHCIGGLIDCNSSEISHLPRRMVGIYRGKLETRGVDTRKGICTIVETGCKTYRLDFSNGVPSIHGVQFGRKNDFDEYTSVVIEGEYSSAIEVDLSFNDLEIDGKVLIVSFDGKKN
ncbi:hypothetical protein [Aquimarina sp. MMG016]|uniref:hypothetical protein n=1 Tax=Aquimarina sp. MMG016 TaxID=2822690 RepID=UPI001B39F599|nr:hypothetical protein [Aquimarina sp. MMG016]MBQ4820632.1 hypothetical protein [Aquimarina sp. MMG016]